MNQDMQLRASFICVSEVQVASYPPKIARRLFVEIALYLVEGI